MTLKNGFGKCSLFVSSVNEWKDQIWPLRFPTREKPNMEEGLFDWPIVLQYDVKAKYRLILESFQAWRFSLACVASIPANIF